MARTQFQWPLKLICAAMAAGFAQHAAALPTDAVVTSGTAAFAQTGNVLTVTNSNRAIINWGSFSIGRGETVRFDQAASSSVLNRVVGITVDGRRVIAPSEILGYLQSPGKVFLLNPSGTIIGAGAVIDVAGFVASSLMLSDADFLANRLRFTNIDGAGNIQNFGEIKTTSGGNVYLIAPNVENHGIIQSPSGEVILAAGKSVELLDSGTPGVKVAVTAGGEALNVGQLLSESGRVGMVGAVVRQQGTISADSIVREGGRIFLKATQSAELAAGSLTSANGTQGGTVQVESEDQTLVSGTISATGSSAAGGRIELLGDKVGVFSGAVVDASGETGGGTVLVGGDYQGKNPEVRNADFTFLAEGASVRADARSTGNGGKVIFWADDTTRAYGSISARGGNTSGDGGFVEVSGKQSLTFDALVDTQAPAGKTGTLLLDPFSVTIKNGGSTPIGGASWTESGGPSELNWSSIDTQLMSTDVTIQTTNSGGAGDDIIFMTPGTITASAGATRKLTLIADDNISFSTALSLAGALDASAGGNIQFSDSVMTAGNFTATAGGTIDLMRYKAISSGDMTFTAGGNITMDSSGGFGDSGLIMNKVGGSQTITATGSLSMTGGYNPSGNGTYIKSYGNQSITAGSITLNAGTTSSDNRAEISAAGTQTITTTGAGNLALNTTAAAEALIAAPTQVISVGGNMTLTSGGGAAGRAAIGSKTGAANVQITAGTMNINGDAAASSTIGALDGSSNATIALTATGAGGIALGSYSRLLAGSGSVSFVANAAGGASLTQASFSEIIAQTVSATGNRSIGLDGDYNSITNFSGSSTLASVSFKNNSATAHVTSASGATGVTLSTTAGGNKVLALGTISSTNAPISVTASGAILDDNGSGIANISAGTGNITLTSQNGTATAGALAISTDISTTGTVSANTSGGAYGSIRIGDVGANAAGIVGINASAATAEGAVDYSRYGNVTLGSGAGETALTLTPKTGSLTRIGASGNMTVNSTLSLGAGGSPVNISAGGTLDFLSGTVTISGDASITAGSNLTVSGGNLSLQGSSNSVSAGGLLDIAAGKTITAGMGTLNVSAGSLAVNGTLSGYSDTKVTSTGDINIAGGGSMLSTFGNLTFKANTLNVAQGSVSAAQGIDGTTDSKLTLGAAAGGTSGTINAANGIVKLSVGGAGIEMYNSSYINSTDATQPAGGLIKLMFPGLSAGGSTINGVATFDGGYKVGGALTTLGSGLEVTYGILSNPVSDAIVAAMNSTAGSGGGTSETSGSLALVGAASGTSTTTTSIDGMQTVGGTEGTFGGTEATTTTENSTTTGSTQDTQNVKKKPAQCSA